MRASCQLLGLNARYRFLARASRARASVSTRGLGLPKAAQDAVRTFKSTIGLVRIAKFRVGEGTERPVPERVYSGKGCQSKAVFFLRSKCCLIKTVN